MTNKFYIAICMMTTIFAWSCNDNFLQTPSTDLTEDVIWGDPAIAETYILNLYTSIKLADKEPSKGEGSQGLTRGHHWAMFSSIADETVYSNDDQTYLVQTGQLSPGNFGFTSSAWGRNYVGIRECNDALTRIPNLDLSDQKIKELMAEVRFIRAVRYFELLRSFGGAVLIGDRITTLDDDFSDLYNRSTINETVDYIISELEAAATDLPDRTVQQTGRATSEAALGYISRTLLYAASPLYTQTGAQANDGLNGGSTRTWQEAADAAKAVMNLGFTLVDDLSDDPSENYRLLFISDPDTREDIFYRDYNSVSTTFSGMEIMNTPKSRGGWAGNGPMQNFVDDFEMQDTGLPITDAGSGYDPNNPYEGRDPRFYGSVIYHGLEYRGAPLDINVDAGPNQNQSRTGYFLRKFVDESVTDWWTQGRQSPWRYMRYAEILLNYAEAQNEAFGPDASVYNAVNTVRARANMPNLPNGLTQDSMRERIRNERRVELSFEEHRYYDVRRWLIANDIENRPARKVTYDEATGTYDMTKQADNMGAKSFSVEHYWFPIPQDEITISKGALQQNYMY
ncbi:RagB/SusD family nutrient uptake outer membrane protein [Flammeovirga sp. EKP202]|nr:RagB/SusD family nutrient uptake outer membrane protein [Flammeovirga sp. EKP202]